MFGSEYINDVKEPEVYSEVYGRAVDPSNSSQISDDGGEHTIVGGYTFLWSYAEGGNNGFTGSGWFDTTAGTPLAVYGISGKALEAQLQSGERTNLHDIFSNWQVYATNNPDAHVASEFAKMLPDNCWEQQ